MLCTACKAFWWRLTCAWTHANSGLSNCRQGNLMYLWMLQPALADGTVIAEHLEIVLLWHLLKKAPNHTTARFPHTGQVYLHTKLRCELSMSKHPHACSHLTSATTIMAIKGNQFIDYCLQSNRWFSQIPALPIAFTTSSSLPTAGFCLLVLHGLASRCSYLLQQKGRTIFVFTVQISTSLPLGGDGIYQWPVPAPTSPLWWSPLTSIRPSCVAVAAC